MNLSGPDAQLPAGRVGRAHGLDGSFYVTGAVSRLLTAGARLHLAGRSVEIERRAGTDERPIVRVGGVEDRAAAEALRGERLTVAAAQAPELGEDEWWARELEGCEVRAGERVLGKVTRLLELPSCEVLEVRAGARAEPLLVPMVRDAIGEIDVAAQRIEVDGEFLGLDEELPGPERDETHGGAAGDRHGA
ncbi:MAG TPA: ribosome maturation factor RimM [Solirubrobacteraceae bacterium]|nr:ribosome maturation factor RimM [Solirubrobacteraceae bacterium]